MPFDATVGGATANSYATYAEWQAYIADRPNTPATVSGAVQAVVERAMMAATHDIETLTVWNDDRVGIRVSQSQTLRFPAYDVRNRHNDDYLPSASNPDFAKRAEFEQAITYITGDPVTSAETITERGVRKAKVDVVEVEFDDVDESTVNTGLVLCDAAVRELRYWAASFDESPSDYDVVDITLV